MKRIKLLVVAALAASTMTATAVPAQAQAQARCLPEYYLVCQVIVTICRVTGNPCYA